MKGLQSVDASPCYEGGEWGRGEMWRMCMRGRGRIGERKKDKEGNEANRRREGEVISVNI